MAVIERWYILRHAHGAYGPMLHVATGEFEPEKPLPPGWEVIEVVPAEQLRGAVEALQRIADVDAPPLANWDMRQVAQNALEALGLPPTGGQ